MNARRLSYSLRFAVASVVAALLSFWTVIFFARQQPELVPQLAISTVVVSLSLVRSEERRAGALRALPEWAELVLRFVLVPVVALLALLIGRVVGHSAVLGFAIIGLPLVAAIWMRRFGPVWTRVGSLLSFPFVAAIVTPVAAIAGDGASGPWWGALAALVAVAWAALISFLITGVPAVPRGIPQRYTTSPVEASPAVAEPPPGDPAQPDGGPEGGTTASPAPRRRILPSSRMAVHLAISLAAAILLGAIWLPEHIAWLVLTAYVVNAGNRGRAEVVYKGVQRIVGAAGGTVVASLIAGLFAPRDGTAIAVLFVIIGIGAVLRVWSYAWWAAAMTGALALLYGYLGESSPGLLGERLLAIVLGGAVAIAASYFVLPVRSNDVLRKRAAEALRAVALALRTPASALEFGERLQHALVSLDSVAQLAPAIRARRMITLRRAARASAPADLLDGVVALRHPLAEYAAEPSREAAGALTARLGELRERLLALGPSGAAAGTGSDESAGEG